MSLFLSTRTFSQILKYYDTHFTYTKQNRKSGDNPIINIKQINKSLSILPKWYKYEIRKWKYYWL